MKIIADNVANQLGRLKDTSVCPLPEKEYQVQEKKKSFLHIKATIKAAD